MDLLQFVREVRLPRFTMQAGEQWSLPQCRYTPDGSASLGAGLCPRDSFVVLAVDTDRACGCQCVSENKSTDTSCAPPVAAP